MILLDISITVIVFLVGFNLKNFFSGFSTSERRILNQLFFYHFGIAIAFHFYINNYGGDATHYWEAPKSMPLNMIIELVKGGSASAVIYLINYIPSNLMGLSFFTGNMIYASTGYLGFIYILKIIKYIFTDFSILSQIKLFNIPIFPWIWFLPNFHFWSAGIGKDTILFFSIALFVYSLPNLKKRWVLWLISMFLALVIRPHILLFLLVSFGIGFVFDGGLKNYQKIFMGLIFIVGFVLIFEYVLQFIQLESIETSVIEEYASTKASNLNKAGSGSGIDISGYPFPLKIFTFLYRPLFFDINGILAVVASIENLVLLYFSILVIWGKPLVALKKSNFLLKGMIVYFLLGAIAFSLILGNLGIMLRQKNMFIPLFVIFGSWVLYNKHKNQLQRYESANSHK
jgi:hypothetical protein